MPSAANTYELRACTDCIMLIANGDTSGTARCETEEGEAEYLAAVAANTGNLNLAPSSWPFAPYAIELADAVALVFAGRLDAEVIDFSDEFDIQFGEVTVTGWSEYDYYRGRDCEAEFTYTGCDVCGDGLGGDKHPVTGWVRG